jgi:peptidoglycan/LPS O-acetylase OafA/YrhL
MQTASQPAAPLTRHRHGLGALFGIRFVACLQVVFHHFGSTYALRHGVPLAVVEVVRGGHNPLSIFFMLSGFVLAYTYTGQLGPSGSYKRFAEARFARIYPLYLLALVLSWPFFHPNWGQMLACLTMTQAWNPWRHDLYEAWNFTAWTLSVEAVFYLIFPWLLARLQHRRLRVLQWITAFLLAVMVLGHTSGDVGGITNGTLNTLLYWTPLPLLRLPEFLLGVVLGLMFLRAPHRPTRTWALWSSILVTMAILATVHGQWVSLLMVPNAVLVYELAHDGGVINWFLSRKTMMLLGGAAYSMYLMQYPMRKAMEWVFTHFAPQLKNIGPPLITPLLLIAVAVVIHLRFEEPVRRGLRQWFAERTILKKRLW